MVGGRTRSEKVEVIKSLIRKNNYKNVETTYNQCMDVGISVNQTSLARFSEKLELLDRADRSKRVDRLHAERTNSVPKVMTYEQVKHRETEITFELGELKIRENKLLEELNKLANLLDSKHFN